MVEISRGQEEPEEYTTVWEGTRCLWDLRWLGRVNAASGHRAQARPGSDFSCN